MKIKPNYQKIDMYLKSLKIKEDIIDKRHCQLLFKYRGIIC